MRFKLMRFKDLLLFSYYCYQDRRIMAGFWVFILAGIINNAMN